MVWSSCIISRACAQQAIILFLKWNENSEIFIEKKMLKTNWEVRHQENFELSWRDGEQWWRCGEINRLQPGSVARVRFPDSASYVGWVLYNLLAD